MVAGAVLLVENLMPPVMSDHSALMDLILFVAFAGLWAIVPYSLFLLIYCRFVRPRTSQQLHRMLWWGPGVIAFAFGAFWGLLTVVRGVSGPLRAFAAFGGAALFVGYAYAVVIEAAFRVAKWMRWIEDDQGGAPA